MNKYKVGLTRRRFQGVRRLLIQNVKFYTCKMTFNKQSEHFVNNGPIDLKKQRVALLLRSVSPMRY
jgi:hypothetical protein